jgi:hypothetical protein
MAFPYSGTDAIAIGTYAGSTSQGTGSVAIGYQAGQSSQGTNAIAIGSLAGGSGTQSIALGYNVQTSTLANTIAIGASAVTAISSSSFYVNPVRNATQTTFLGYNTTNKEISYFNQNGTILPSGISTSTTTPTTLTVDFNNVFSSTTRYTVTNTSGTGITITVNNYAFSNAVTGGQYTLVIAITASTGSITYTFNGTGLSTVPIPKTNFTTVTTGSVSSGTTKYVILTIAFDGTNYFMSGSTFS